MDTYQGESEKKWEEYATYDGAGLDPGPMKSFEFPFWNPRELFFATIDARLGQVTGEFICFVNKLDEYMKAYVSFDPTGLCSS